MNEKLKDMLSTIIGKRTVSNGFTPDKTVLFLSKSVNYLFSQLSILDGMIKKIETNDTFLLDDLKILSDHIKTIQGASLDLLTEEQVYL